MSVCAAQKMKPNAGQAHRDRTRTIVVTGDAKSNKVLASNTSHLNGHVSATLGFG